MRYLPRSTHQALPALLFIALALLSPCAAEASSTSFSEEDVRFQNGNVILQGTILAPQETGQATGQATGRRAAIVVIHGAGPKVRGDYRDVAEIFANAGLVTLIYDKRVQGYSASGAGSRSYSILADDALAAVEMLGSRSDVDPANIGLWGESEGGWVAPLAASRSEQVAFVITVGANGITPIQQTAWSLENLFRYQGITSDAMVRSITFNGLRFMVSAEMFAEATYDPVPVLEQLEQPILAIWGSNERNTPPAEAAAIFQDSLNRGGNSRYTLVFIPNAEHSIRASSDGFSAQASFAPGFAETMIAWVNRIAQGDVPGPEIIGEFPQQARLSPSGVNEPTWRDDATLHLAVLIVSILIPVIYFVLGLHRSFRHETAKPLRWNARLLAVLEALVPVGFFAYFFTTLITYSAGPVLEIGGGGQPVVWLVLRLLAWGVIVLGLALAVHGWRLRSTVRRSERARLGLLLAGALILTPWALHWRLLA